MSQAGELIAISTFSFPQNKFASTYSIVSLFAKLSVGLFNNLIRGAMNTGDSKQIAISLKNRLFDRKLRLGKSIAKLIYFSLSFFSIKAVVRLI